jgi:group II intron reverse transcriptase/maturase
MYEIDKQLIYQSWLKVSDKEGAAGVDKLTIEEIEKDYKPHLYKLWNRMSSGSYMGSPVRKVEIPKSDGKKRILGIPTVLDRVAQTAAVKVIETRLDAEFHEDSYGYRPKRSAHQAIGQARERCFKFPWVVDLDIQGFFDTIPHDLLMEMVERRIEEKWIKLYIKRWLEASMQDSQGNITKREQGTPQGGVISPLLANMYLDEVFDWWITKEYPGVKFERYADDIIVHCNSYAESRRILESIEARMAQYGLKLHPEKTKIVYCKCAGRKEAYPGVTFTFLGYDWKPRGCINRATGKKTTTYTPAVSSKAKKKIKDKIRGWKIKQKIHMELADIANSINATLQGWKAYYGKFRKSELDETLKYLDEQLVKWIRKKYKFKDSWAKAWAKLKAIRRSDPSLFSHWPTSA